jgi:hemerythrin-like domain-containing protein
MEEYLNKGIKEVINQFPEVEDILNEYDIGCAPCMVGTCLLKDIVQIHNLNRDDEQAMMAKIATAIYPDKEITVPETKSSNKGKPKEIGYSPPMKILVDEHVLIKRWVALIPEVIKNLDVESDEGRQLIMDGVDFIRTYADKTHHGKEEEILFKYFDEELDILKVMHADHKKGRSHVKAILEALEIKDTAAIAEHLNAYRELLIEHIKKEDEILFPWMDKNLSTRQIGELFSKFNETDDQIGYSPSKYQDFIDRLEKKFNQN